MQRHIRPNVTGKTWIRARDHYPENGQRVLYWLEEIGGPFEGFYEEETYDFRHPDGSEGVAIDHIFGGTHGWLTNDDVYYIPLEPNEPIPPFQKNRDRIDPVEWEYMEDE